MKTFILKRIKKILENKKILEKKLNIKLFSEGRKLTIEGSELEEFIASKVIEAIEIGFKVETTLQLVEPEYILEKIEIKNLTKRKSLEEVRARVIGKEGRTKELVEELSECEISIHGNEIGVIGEAEKIKGCMHALVMLVQGSKQSSVYAYLEKQRKIMHPGDLGLKE